ncbi:25569_t:CDS:2 [Gigaspora margarita]|uniref:25569_t:CDS:1 n=1 Tax=Gigaspora margarita TaxID=4874 RepID=A0ABM8W4C9_GIGMA|nr:25569_t:CDS:2 [Gigaspora margarita]
MQTVLEDRIVERWDRAFQRGELLYIETEVAHIKEKEIEFQIRVAPSLAKKPTGKLGVKDEEQQKSKANPFLPYKFEKQTDPLNPEDLECIWFCIMQIKSRPVLAFFNCGELSGGSQPHKHMQVIPLPSDVRFTPPINSCIYGSQEFKKPGEIFDIPELPYVHYISLLDPQQLSLGHGRHEEVSHYLNDVFHSLLDAMIESLHKQSSLLSLNSLSYNVVMTSTWLMIVPRSKEKYENMSVNSLGYAGMLLTKRKEELELVKDAGVLNILESLAFSKQNVIMDESN